MCNIAINFIDQSYHQTISFAANAMQLIINEQSQQHEKAAIDLRRGLEDVAKFDFVGGGVIEIPASCLIGATMELKRISKAIEKGIVIFPVLGCDNVHSYLENMPYNTLKQIPIIIQNLGVEENPKLRKFPFMKPSRHESKENTKGPCSSSINPGVEEYNRAKEKRSNRRGCRI